jgi:WD40 repeat protein
MRQIIQKKKKIAKNIKKKIDSDSSEAIISNTESDDSDNSDNKSDDETESDSSPEAPNRKERKTSKKVVIPKSSNQSNNITSKSTTKISSSSTKNIKLNVPNRLNENIESEDEKFNINLAVFNKNKKKYILEFKKWSNQPVYIKASDFSKKKIYIRATIDQVKNLFNITNSTSNNNQLWNFDCLNTLSIWFNVEFNRNNSSSSSSSSSSVSSYFNNFAPALLVKDQNGIESLIPPFKGIARKINNKKGDIDYLLNTAAPIKSIAFSPKIKEWNKKDKSKYKYEDYLAIGTTQFGWGSCDCPVNLNNDTVKVGTIKKHLLGVRDESPNLLQIWKISESIDSNPIDATLINLNYCVSLNNRGGIWNMNWSSLNYNTSYDNSIIDDKVDNLLGVLAVACGNGSCLVLVLPKNINNEKISNIENIPVVPEDCVCKWEIIIPNKYIQCVQWSPHNPLQLCCGLIDGSVVLWNLNSNMSDKLLTYPTIKLFDFLSASDSFTKTSIETVKFCPYDSNLIASAGFEGTLKIWSLNDTHRPLYSRYNMSSLSGWLYDMEWDPCGMGIYLGGSDTTSVSIY